MNIIIEYQEWFHVYIFTLCIEDTKCTYYMVFCIGIAPITHYTHVLNKISNTQGGSPNVSKATFRTLRNCS